MIDIFLHNFPALVIALPMLFAPLVAMISPAGKMSRWLMWLFTFIAVSLSFVGSIYLAYVVYNIGPLSYFMGAWAPPIGIEYEATKFNSLLLMIISGIALILMPMAAKTIEREIPHPRTGLFYACFLLMFAGLMGMVITNDIFNIYVFLEISSLATYALVAMGQTRAALTAAFNYLIVGTIGGTLFLLGIAFLYIITGSLNISDISYQISALASNRLEVAALIFIFTGLAIKAAIVPFAGWLPRVYANSPSFIAAFISGVSTKVPLYLIAKLLFVIFGMETSLQKYQLSNIIILMAGAAVFYGGLGAIYNKELKRVLAFSSIANVGFILLGIAISSKASLTAAAILFIAHAFSKSGMFTIAALNNGNIKGLASKHPYLAGLVIIYGLSLIGVPLTAGFLPKWFILIAGAETGGFKSILTLFIIIGGSLVSAIYVWRIIAQMFEHDEYNAVITWHYKLTLNIFALLIIIAGFAGSPLGFYLGGMAREFVK